MGKYQFRLCQLLSRQVEDAETKRNGSFVNKQYLGVRLNDLLAKTLSGEPLSENELREQAQLKQERRAAEQAFESAERRVKASSSEYQETCQGFDIPKQLIEQKCASLAVSMDNFCRSVANKGT